MKVLFSFVEGLADSGIYWVVVIRAGLVRAAIVRMRPHLGLCWIGLLVGQVGRRLRQRRRSCAKRLATPRASEEPLGGRD